MPRNVDLIVGRAAVGGDLAAVRSDPVSIASSVTAVPVSGGLWQYDTGPMARLDPNNTGFDNRVTGRVVWWEDLSNPGDTVTQGLNRIPTNNPATVSFPAGVFSQPDFNTGGSQYAHVWPGQCVGVWGSGRGTKDGTTGTIFTMPARSSTKVGNVAAQGSSSPTQMRVVWHGGHSSYPNRPLSYAQFQVRGTDQGHIYHGMTVSNANTTDGSATMHDVLFTGTFGDNGAPPGETFQLELLGGKGHLVYDVECDGRMVGKGETSMAAVGITCGSGYQSVIRNTHIHHTRAACFVFFRYFDGKTYDLKLEKFANNLDAGPDPVTAYINQGVSHPTSGAVTAFCLNHEVTDGCEHWNPVLLAKPWNLGQPLNSSYTRGVNLTHSNGSGYNVTIDGEARNQVNGSLLVVNPTFTPLWAELSDQYLWVQSWTSGITDAPSTQTTPPLIVMANGSTHIPYKFNKGTTIVVP